MVALKHVLVATDFGEPAGIALDYGREYAAKQGWSGVEISAQPRAVSPFNWTVFASDELVHRYAHVNLAREAPHPPAHEHEPRLRQRVEDLARRVPHPRGHLRRDR